MVEKIKNEMKKTYMKLLKAWTKGKEKKAIKLQRKLLQMEIDKK